MNAKYAAPLALVALIGLGATAQIGYASERSERQNDAAALANAKVTLQQAVATAEQQAGGRAASADLQQDKGVPQFEVEVVGQQGVKTVLVNAQTGTVTAIHAGEQQDND